LGFDISITNSAIFMFLVVALICGVFWVATKDRGIIPTKLQVVVEKMFFLVGGIVKSNAGKRGIEIFPYMIALFLFIMLGNIIGLFPFAFSYTSQLCITIGMALIVFFASIIVGIMNQGMGYFRRFCPSGIPGYLVPFFIIIELLSFLFRPISLGIRLFANMVSGHIMIEVIAGFAASIASIAVFSYFSAVPVAVNVALNLFKFVVCMLQAYVFVVLSCMYLSESLEPQAH
ncbi:MAG: F0F1 ATP synthase subunit A, partial [Alphaproteobacteria bacterium]|nr:F0F1 ATP synthase subunit A [Alphaproteobacteria bacterium]